VIAINVIISEDLASVRQALAEAGIAGLEEISRDVVDYARRSIRDHRVSVYSDAVLGGGYDLVYKSPPGKPPGTKGERGHNLRDAIINNRDPSGLGDAIRKRGLERSFPDKPLLSIGTNKAEIGNIGAVMEFGGEYKGQSFAARPYLRPAMKTAIDVESGKFNAAIRAAGELGGGNGFKQGTFFKYIDPDYERVNVSY
jgi:hypothetical protein